jgi:alginate O-acetyltransferase complex protein AlgI
VPFNSLQYLRFFLLVLAVSWLLVRYRSLRLWFLLAASFYFYASNNGWLTLIICATTTIDYLICRGLERVEGDKARRLLVAVSIVSNLGILVWFKYSNFLGLSLVRLASLVGLQLDWVSINVILPVGISFYTFEALSYTIDVYRRKIPAEKDWTQLAFLVTFFPHLIAGPIVRAADFFPQMGRPPRLTREDVRCAIARITGGLIKKMVLADGLAPFSDAAFDQASAVGTLRAWLGVYAFAFQIFFDFSGYTDIAIGCAKLLGINLPENFRRPYAALSVTDFWHRWHITLSTWLRDYLYIPLGGNRGRTRLSVYRNLMITMLLGGLWHGAAWTFVFWGALHGLCLTTERAFGVARAPQSTTSRRLDPLRSFLVFNLIALTWIPFRSGSIHQMEWVLRQMFSPIPSETLNSAELAAALIVAGAWLWQQLTDHIVFSQVSQKYSPVFKFVAYSFLIAAVLLTATIYFLGAAQAPTTFIYFRF